MKLNQGMGRMKSNQRKVLIKSNRGMELIKSIQYIQSEQMDRYYIMPYGKTSNHDILQDTQSC